MEKSIRRVLVSILLLLALVPMLSSAPHAHSQELTTVTRFATTTTYFTSLEYQTSTRQSKQSFHEVLTVPSGPEPLPGYGTTTCMIFAIGPFRAQVGDEVSSTVSADSEISLDIFDSGLASSVASSFAALPRAIRTPTDYAKLVGTCMALAYSPSGMKGAYGRAFSASWKANVTDDYYFVFENWKTIPAHASLDAVLTSFTYSISTVTHTPTTTITITNARVAPRYIYLIQENITIIALVVAATILSVLVLRRRVVRRKSGPQR